MVTPRIESLLDHRLIGVEKDEIDVVMPGAQDVAIAPAQGRAGEHDALASRPARVQLRGETLEPGLPVDIGQRLAALHLLGIFWRMKTGAFQESGANPVADALAHRRRSHSRGAHHAHDSSLSSWA